MSRSIGIIAAMPAELLPLVKGWERLPKSGGISAWRTSLQGSEFVAVCAGMGAAPATRSLVRVRELLHPSLVVSVGWAGALTPDLAVGAVVRPEAVLDARTGERYGSETPASLLVTLGHMAGVEEKGRLRSAYRHAIAVDMEAATLARLCAASGCEFRAIKAISDSSTAHLPDMNAFVTPHGTFRTVRFVSHVSRRPRHWMSMTRLGRHSRLAAQSLARAIEQDFEMKGPGR